MSLVFLSQPQMMQAQSLRDTLLAMPLPRLQEYVRLHKDDPYVVTMALSIANDKKKAATAQQGMAGRQPQPTVVDQQIAQMGPSAAPMPEDVGIGQLPAQNMQGMAGGGIVAFDGGGEVPRYQSAGLVATPIGRWWGGLKADADVASEEEKLRNKLREYYGPRSALPGMFMQQTDADRARAKQINALLPKLKMAELEQLQKEGPSAVLGAGATAPTVAVDPQAYDPKQFPMPQGQAIPAPTVYSGAPLQTGEKLQKTEADNLTELKKQYNALTGGRGAGASMPSTAGLPDLKQMSSDEAKEAATKLVGDVNELPAMKMFQEQKNTFLERQKQREEAFLNEQALLPKFGVEAEQQLKAREKELAEDKKAAGWMSLIEAGLATMAGTSQFAFTNIGAGAQKGLASYRDSVKDFKKLQAEYDKMRVDIERGKVEEARGNFKARQEFFDRADTARDNFMKKGIDIVQSHTGLGIQAATQVFTTGIQQYGETARTVFREKGATDRSRAENESRVALGLLQLEQQQLPPELRGAMLLGTGDTKAERLQTGIPSLMALKDRMTETKLAELYQKHVTDSRKNLTEPMSPKDFAKSVRASINSFYPQVGDVSTNNLLKR
jgi:hypothetical protein